MERKRSGGLLLVVIVGLLLGVLGGCGGLFGLVGQLAQDSMRGISQDLIEASAQGGDPEMVRRQLEMQERAEAVVAPWRPALIGHQILNVLVSLALLAGCVLLLRWHASGPALFVGAALASAFIDTAGGALGLWLQLETAEVVKELMADMAAADPNLPADAARSMGAAASAGAYVGICFAGVWIVLKLGYYVAAAVYLRKPAVRALFTP